MELFKKITHGIHLLKSPFNKEWSGIVLLRGNKNILIDSGASREVVDNYLLPALEKENLNLDDINLLVNTHCHGDHIGGHRRIRELSSVKIGVYEGSIDKIRFPHKYAKSIRSIFKLHSPPPPQILEGVEPDFLLSDNDLLVGRLRLIHTPGHDDDAVCWLDEKTGTLISGDSLQGSGAAGAGLAFYQDLTAYRKSLKRLFSKDIKNILAGHSYSPYGPYAIGEAAVNKYLKNCVAVTERYDEFIKECLINGERDHVLIARDLIKKEDREIPEHLFLALFTIRAHINTYSI